MRCDRLHRPGPLDVQSGVGSAVVSGDGPAELGDVGEFSVIDAVQGRGAEQQQEDGGGDERGGSHAGSGCEALEENLSDSWAAFELHLSPPLPALRERGMGAFRGRSNGCQMMADRCARHGVPSRLRVLNLPARPEFTMPDTNALYQWTDRVASRFPNFPAQATGLAWYRFGMVLAHSCGLDAVALHLALSLARSTNTLRQRLRDLYQPAAVKSGRHRTEFDPTACFGPLLRWLTAD